MTFTDQQKADLAKPLSTSAVKDRTQGGRKVSYIEGWHAIAEANRIFGFDGWTRETDEIRCVAEFERAIGQQAKPGWSVTYTARVRVRVGNITREGCGAGHGIDTDKGQAHESAIKEAETDAMKRALMTFGNPFGLALYDKTQANVADEPPPLITDGQRDELATLAQAAGVTLQRICEGCEITRLNDLPAARFDAVRNRLKLTIEQKQKEPA